MFDEERPVFQPRYITIPEVWELYREQDKPLNADTILATLEPLAGTSFFQRLMQALSEAIPVKQPDALDLYVAFYYRVLDAWQDPQRTDEAIRCVAQLSGFRVPRENVYAMDYLEADELLLREYRRDWLYYDYDHSHYAGSHRASQFWMYKRGDLRSILTFSLVDYEEPPLSHRFFHHAILAEGTLDHAFFTDKTRRPMLSLDPRQSLFRTSLPLLYISPQFSIEEVQP
jgi:hypothetical protein